VVLPEVVPLRAEESDDFTALHQNRKDCSFRRNNPNLASILLFCEKSEERFLPFQSPDSSSFIQIRNLRG